MIISLARAVGLFSKAFPNSRPAQFKMNPLEEDMESKVCINEDYYYIMCHNFRFEENTTTSYTYSGTREQISRCKDKLSTGRGPVANLLRARHLC